ncbi:hypothetical protein HYC85_020205 [Camellia sinensis]|uniref:Uncharacterized protein n=1 Tax=Camellia sinensis TaxID=4442 RepID=A0A7J7GP43_CAMSI|nr:hypothetical protein HYC85_020205 [Camellia sinensis]
MNCLNILWYPSSLSFMQSLCSGNDSSILAVTEGCQLSIWDLRMKENGGCVHRIYGSVGDIFYAVCSSSTSIAVGGADCTVTVYDPRRSTHLELYFYLGPLRKIVDLVKDFLLIQVVRGFIAITVRAIIPF